MCFLFGRRKILETQKALCEKTERLADQAMRIERNVRETIATVVATSNVAVQDGVKNTLDAVAARVRDSLENNEKSLDALRGSVERNLGEMRAGNEKKLDEMREVVEKKFANALSERLTATVGTINERLDAVNKNLAEMESLTDGVTDLRRMLGNVKDRGTFGEMSLLNILENILTREQFVTQFNVGEPGGAVKKVDFAIAMPGTERGRAAYLPIDSKFPLESYRRLEAASDRGDAESAIKAGKELDDAIKKQAKSISENYVRPPVTLDFALMYLPTEGLYAEVARKPGLIEELSRKYRVVPVGPVTVTAFLHSLQMGFRTLAVRRSSREIMELLAKFRSEFKGFAISIEEAQRQIGTAGKTLDKASARTTKILTTLDRAETLSDRSDAGGEEIE